MFTDADEEASSTYLITLSKMFLGLTRCTTRRLHTSTLSDVVRLAWHANKMAGVDWLHGFLKRRSEFGLRMSQATSFSRATSFNLTNVSPLFANFETVIRRHAYKLRQIWNLDETGLTTVQKPGKVLTQKGLKQVGQITSAELGTLVTLVTLCCCINAVGHALPLPIYFHV